MPFDYSREADRYDISRGGEQRAPAAVAAISQLVPHPGTLLDAGGGTGIISLGLAALGHKVAVSDLIIEMLRHAQARLLAQQSAWTRLGSQSRTPQSTP